MLKVRPVAASGSFGAENSVGGTRRWSLVVGPWPSRTSCFVHRALLGCCVRRATCYVRRFFRRPTPKDRRRCFFPSRNHNLLRDSRIDGDNVVVARSVVKNPYHCLVCTLNRADQPSF